MPCHFPLLRLVHARLRYVDFDIWRRAYIERYIQNFCL
ncbi:hypothetical protein L810_7893 [Burkholderia sp. AU4i]|nr:hypothetical protein L810_7893 [Burkholderia sp. AU4i]